MQLLINPVDRPNGRTFAEQVFEMDTKDAQALIEYAIHHSRFYYVAGRKVYQTNHKALNAVKNGTYRIKH